MGSEKESRAQKTALDAVRALGRGFDVTADIRTKFCKRPLVELNNDRSQKITVPGGITIDVPTDVKCDKGERMRFTSDVMQFQQMSESFNKYSLIEGKVPLGHFNAMYDFSGSWLEDATQTKSVALDGCFITLYKLQLTRSLVLRKKVRDAVPSAWEPAGLARFISKYGTHIIVSVSIGGQDVLYLKENRSSLMSATDIHQILKRFGDQKFTDGSGQRDSIIKGNENKEKMRDVYALGGHGPHTEMAYVQGTQLLLNNKDITIISRKRGGNVSARTHCEWQSTVNSAPDVILMSFVPITVLLSGTPGGGFLNHAINLYLRYKPPVDEIQYFLEFQIPRQWAPVYSELPLGPPQKEATLPSMQFCLMGPRLYVNTTQVSVVRKPVTGLRLYLEGRKNNRLAIHLQHLSSLPRVLQPYWNETVTIEQPKWHGSDDRDTSSWFEPVQCRGFSHVCTAPIKFNPDWLGAKDGVFVVTGAQLEVKSHGLKNVLHLRLLFTRVPGCTIQKSRWDQPPITTSQRSGFFSALSTTFSSHTVKKTIKSSPFVMNSGVFFGAPPMPFQQPKLLKFVNTRELTKGPEDMPGHWLVTAAQLDLEGSKICLRVKYSLLNYELG